MADLPFSDITIDNLPISSQPEATIPRVMLPTDIYVRACRVNISILTHGLITRHSEDDIKTPHTASLLYSRSISAINQIYY